MTVLKLDSLIRGEYIVDGKLTFTIALLSKAGDIVQEVKELYETLNKQYVQYNNKEYLVERVSAYLYKTGKVGPFISLIVKKIK